MSKDVKMKFSGFTEVLSLCYVPPIAHGRAVIRAVFLVYVKSPPGAGSV